MRPLRGAISLGLIILMGCAQEETKMIGANVKDSIANPENLEEQGAGSDAIAKRGSTDQNGELADGSEIVVLGEDELNYSEELIVVEKRTPSESPEAGNPPPGEELNLIAFACASSAKVLKGGETYQFSWQIPQNGSGFYVAIESDQANVYGELTIESPGLVSYRAPSKIAYETQITLLGSLDDGSAAECNLVLQADKDLGVKDDGLLDGLVGNIYQLDATTKKLPDFSTMTPLSTIVSSNLDVPERSFDTGFPGVPNLFEWFGIAYKGKITIPVSGEYSIKLVSDDGAILYIDDQEIINNDGTHSTKSVSTTVSLTAGQKSFAVDYFQGPRYHIALQLFWKIPGSPDYTIIPKEYFHRQK